MFIALEVLSLPLYLICGLARRRRLLSQEAAVKYFLLGAFASAFFLYGLALVYGTTGNIRLSGIRGSVGADGTGTLLVLGLALLVVGLMFKASVAPFHTWTPDVYQGAPTPVTAFMAACTKVAAFGAILRVLYVAFGTAAGPGGRGLRRGDRLHGGRRRARPDPDRRQAHARLLLDRPRRLPADRGTAWARPGPGFGTLFYLLTYGFTAIGAFGVVTLVRDADGEATQLSPCAGLARRSPLLAAVSPSPAGPGRDPADQRVHRQVRGLPGGDGWAPPLVVVALVSSAIAGVLLPADRRAHVLLRAGRGRALRRRPRAPTTIVLAVTWPPPWCWGSSPGRCWTWPTAPPRWSGGQPSAPGPAETRFTGDERSQRPHLPR